MSLRMNLPLIACAALACAAGPAFAANPVCPVSHICVTATERENQKLVLVDLTANTVTDIFVTPALPDSLLLDTQRRLIYDETVANQVRRYDPATNTDVLVAGPVQGIANPFDMILDPVLPLLYVSNFSGIGGDKITITDLSAPLPNATTCPTPVVAPQGLAFDNAGNLYVLAKNTPGMPGASGIYRISKTTCAVLLSNVGFDPTNSLDGLTFDPSTNRLFATSNSGNSVYSIDPTTLMAVNIANGTVPLPDGIINDSHGLLYIASRTGFVYSATEAAVSVVTQLTPVPTIDDLGIVPAQAPTGVKTFTPKTGPTGFTSTLTIQVTNPNPTIPLNGVSFTDNLPAGVVVSVVPNLTNTCGGTVTGATAGSMTVSLAPPPPNTLAAGASCTVTFSVTDNNPPLTMSQNCVTVTSQNGGPGAQSCDTLTVLGVTTPPVIAKSFAPTQIMLNGTSTLTVSIMNPNTFPLTNVSFNDPLPAGVTVASPPLTNTCGGTIMFAPAVAPFTSFSLSGATLAAGVTCTMTFTVTGTTAGVKNNVTSAVTGVDPNGTTVTGNMASAQLVVVGPPAIAKSFNPGSIVVGGISTLTFLITNPNPTIPLTGVGFTDTLPAIVQVSATQASPFVACGGTVTATPLGSSIMLAGGTLAAGGSCTFSVSVTGVSLGMGAQINTTSTVSSNEGGPGAPATAPIAVVAAPSSLEVFQIRYAANLDKGDSYVNLSNAGTLNGFAPAGNICVNVYTFDPAEEMVSCCACLVTPNGLNTLSVQKDLISNTLTPGKPTSVVIKLLASIPAPIAGTCNASTPTAATLVRGMSAWGTTLHPLPTSPVVTYGKTETPFSPVELSATELSKITTFCGFIQSIGSGFGICKSCQVGTQGGETK